MHVVSDVRFICLDELSVSFIGGINVLVVSLVENIDVLMESFLRTLDVVLFTFSGRLIVSGRVLTSVVRRLSGFVRGRDCLANSAR